MARSLTGLRVLIIAGLLGGCAQATLTAASDLGTAGQKGAQAMKQATTLSDDQIAGLRRARRFHHAFIAAQAGSAPGPDLTTRQLDDFETFLGAETKFLDSLAAAYGALAGLATYDTAGKFNTAFAGLVTDTNGLLKTADPKMGGLPATATSVVQNLGGLFLAMRQRQQVIDASKAMRVPLQHAIDLLGQKGVRATFDANVDIYVSENRKALLDLYRLHVFTVAPTVDEMGMVIGAKSVPDLDGRVAADPALRDAVKAIADPRITLDKLKADMTRNYDTTLAALSKLPALHDKLEAGEMPDISQFIAIVNQIKPLVKLVRQES